MRQTERSGLIEQKPWPRPFEDVDDQPRPHEKTEQSDVGWQGASDYSNCF